MIECNNCDIELTTATGSVVLAFPKSYDESLNVLYSELQAKRITQVYVKLDMPRKLRTTGKNSQNAHFNAHVQQIAQHTGDSFDDVKMHLKREAISMGYPYHSDSFGNVVPNSEADASTVECSYLIDTAHRIASDFRIKLREE